MKVFSHRGFHKTNPTIIENTIPAFKEAEKLGVDGFELDVHLTRDDYLVVHHNYTFYNDKPIVSQSYEELKALADDFGYEFNTLNEVFDAFPNMFINVESKVRDVSISEKLAELIKEYDRLDNTVVSSFGTDVLFALRECLPDLKLAYLIFVYWNTKNIKAVHNKVGLYSVNPYVKLIFPNLKKFAKSNNVELHSWTVNSASSIKKLAKIPIHAIISDYPDMAIEVRDSLNIS